MTQDDLKAIGRALRAHAVAHPLNPAETLAMTGRPLPAAFKQRFMVGAREMQLAVTLHTVRDGPRQLHASVTAGDGGSISDGELAQVMAGVARDGEEPLLMDGPLMGQRVRHMVIRDPAP